MAVAEHATLMSQLRPLPKVIPRPVLLSTPAAHPLPFGGKVVMHHPGYEGVDDYLIVFNAVDRQQFGIHFGMVHVACGIIAGNRWDGYIT